MATIKSYTDIEQSRKLTDILPLESADMIYLKREINDTFIETPIVKPIGNVEKSLCCWSLAALLDVLPKICYPVKDHPTYLILGKPKDKWCALYWDTTGMQDGEQTLADNPVDACVAMIEKLNELKML